VVWLCHRFCLSLRDVDDVMDERGILDSYETVRQWCRELARVRLRAAKRRPVGLGDTRSLDDVLVTIEGRRRHLWPAP